jgi:diguanylate cyclase (GGDEF)-like protein
MIEISKHYFILILVLSFLIGGLFIYFFLKKRLNNLKKLSETDEMTNLLNYSTFYNVLRQFCKQKRLFALLLIDLNDFKQVNDTKGYQEGDKLIKKTADYLKSCPRTTDIIARYKIGDEFAILITDVNNNELELICKRIVQDSYFVQFSIGASLFNSICNDNTDKIVKRTEAALKEAKTNKQDYIII